MTKFLDSSGVGHLAGKIKDGTIEAGKAASVPFSGVTDKPTTLSGYGITDAILKTLTVGAASKTVGADGALSFGQSDILPTYYSSTVDNMTESVARYVDADNEKISSVTLISKGLLIYVDYIPSNSHGSTYTAYSYQYLFIDGTIKVRTKTTTITYSGTTPTTTSSWGDWSVLIPETDEALTASEINTALTL